MRAWQINHEFGIENLTLADRPDLQPGHGQIAIRVKATSLNYRDLMTVKYGGMRGSQSAVDSPVRRRGRGGCHGRGCDAGETGRPSRRYFLSKLAGRWGRMRHMGPQRSAVPWTACGLNWSSYTKTGW